MTLELDNNLPQIDFTKYYAQIKGYLTRIIGDSNAAEDVAQDAFEKIVRKNQNYDRNSNLRGWIFAIAKNASIDYIRRRSIRKTDSLDSELTISITDPTPEEETIGREAETQFRYFCENHSNQDAVEVLQLSMQGYSNKEISETLSIPIGTVGIRLFRMRKELADYLLEE
ncbi:MAG TPA: RNA polymerase sigma factor [Candidatus Nanoarchaeia archaeon]|nr:RNA polymerase sigma factor [Candidatus Nanoarchaeia archaeon]